MREYVGRDREMMESYKRSVFNDQSSLCSSFLDDCVPGKLCTDKGLGDVKFLEAKMLSLRQREEASNRQNAQRLNKENSMISFDSEKAFNESHAHYRNQSTLLREEQSNFAYGNESISTVKQPNKSQVEPKQCREIPSRQIVKEAAEFSEDFKALLDSKYQAYLKRMKQPAKPNVSYLNSIENLRRQITPYGLHKEILPHDKCVEHANAKDDKGLYHRNREDIKQGIDQLHIKHMRREKSGKKERAVESACKTKYSSNKPCNRSKISNDRKYRVCCLSKERLVKVNAKKARSSNKKINKSTIVAKSGCDCDKLIRMLKQHIDACPEFATKLKLECFR
eukprot:TRINITY_DN11403_c0_g1_i4.p1 TRINITY_DN11403_c0_g1~~TRINITY_DN11403_c0_g1_i4.p1  ORF type:complete len:337 (+),score=50.18 TRINITY_DN11403_c0_g1_i4:119-1129(+)